MCHIRYKLIVKCKCFQNGFCPENTSKTESKGWHIRQQSPTFPAIIYVITLQTCTTSHIKDLDFLAVLRPWLQKGCRSQNPYINDKHLLIQEARSE